MKKWKWNSIYMTYFILSAGGFVTKIWHLKVWEKRVFTKSAALHKMWDGQGLKDACFFETFLESQNHREKIILWGRNWAHWQDNFLNED